MPSRGRRLARRYLPHRVRAAGLILVGKQAPPKPAHPAKRAKAGEVGQGGQGAAPEVPGQPAKAGGPSAGTPGGERVATGRHAS